MIQGSEENKDEGIFIYIISKHNVFLKQKWYNTEYGIYYLYGF